MVLAWTHDSRQVSRRDAPSRLSGENAGPRRSTCSRQLGPSRWTTTNALRRMDAAWSRTTRLQRHRHRLSGLSSGRGRATAVAIDPADPTEHDLYRWRRRAESGNPPTPPPASPINVTWSAVTDNQATLSIGSIAIQPGNSNSRAKCDSCGHRRSG